MALLLLVGGVSRDSALHAQISVTRTVIAGGGGTTSSAGHTARGTLSQTAVGRLAHAVDDRHDVGFWYWAYQPEVVTKVRLPHIEAEPGTRVTVPLHLTVLASRNPFLPRPFTARIRFNHTLLHPVGNTPACTYDGGDCALEVTGVATSDEGIIAELEFLVALGDTESTPLTIERFEWQKKSEERIAVAREHGELRLLGVCRVGGSLRLIRSGAYESHLRVWPNPAAERATLEFVSAEAGPLKVRLIDLLGNDAATFVATDVEAQRLYSIEIDLGSIPSGTYVVVCTTPSQALTQSLIISH